MVFPSEPWLRAFVTAVNGHPDLPDALQGLAVDLVAVVEADPPASRGTFAAYGRQQAGRIAEVRVLPDVDEVWELEPAYLVRAPYRIWKGLIRGDDPVRAALTGQVRIQGDLQALVRRANYRYVVDAALRAVATEFLDEGGSR